MLVDFFWDIKKLRQAGLPCPQTIWSGCRFHVFHMFIWGSHPAQWILCRFRDWKEILIFCSQIFLSWLLRKLGFIHWMRKSFGCWNAVELWGWSELQDFRDEERQICAWNCLPIFRWHQESYHGILIVLWRKRSWCFRVHTLRESMKVSVSNQNKFELEWINLDLKEEGN